MSSRGISRSRLILGATMLLLACKDTTAPRVASTMSAHSAVTQSARAGTVVTETPSVLVLDQDGQPLSGATVTFVVIEGGGTVSGSPATTDAVGIAHLSSWTLGSDGMKNVVRATAGSVSTDFEATALVAASLEITSVQSQQAMVGTQVSSVPAVRVLDQNGQPLAGVSVGFQITSGGGALIGATAISDATGIATSGPWTLGQIVGVNVVTATVGALTASFAATGTIGPAARLVYVSGTQQTGTVHTTLAAPFTAKVTDKYGNVVKGASVTVAVTAGQNVGASASATSVVSGDDGTVQAFLTLGDSAGPNEMSMTLPGLQSSSLVFAAIADWRRLKAATLSGRFRHACAAGVDRTVYCWGEGSSGQIGDGTTASRAIATRVGGDVALVSATVGMNTSCGLDALGKAYCWGDNFMSVLPGTFTASTVPLAVNGSLAFRALGVGNTFACGLTTADSAYCWGNNEYGELGDGTSSLGSPAPTAVQGGLSFRSLSLGLDHACGLTTSGAVYCWGSNRYGEVGTGDTTIRHDTPMAIAIQGKTFTAVAAGWFNSCALDQDGAAYCWGRNQYGEIGLPLSTTYSATPIAVGGGLRFTKLFEALRRYCGIVTTGETFCWGYVPSTIDSQVTSPTPRQVSALAGLTSLIGEMDWLCGVREQGDAVCVGQNTIGQLGDGVLGFHQRSIPERVRAP